MKKFLILDNAIVLTLSILITLGIVFCSNPSKTPVLGNYNVSGGGTYRLQSSIGTTDNTITLSSFTEPISGVKYTMSYLNSSIEYATIEPQSNNKEFVSFTGITQNADNSATLTGVVRGLSPSYPFTASTTFQLPHSGQSIFILSNPPQLYNNFASLINANSFLGVSTFSSTSQPVYDGAPTFTNPLALVDKFYADSLVVGAGVVGSNTVPGIFMTATGLQAASSTASGIYNSTSYLRVLPASIATDTPNVGTNTSDVLMSDLTGHLKQAWIDLTAAFTVSGSWIFNGLATFNATTTFNGATVFNSSTSGVTIATTTTAGETITAGQPVSWSFYQSDGGVTYDNSYNGYTSNTSISQALTIGNNSNRIVIAVVSNSNARSYSGTQFGGSNMTLLDSESAGNYTYVYYIVAPATGSQNFTTTASGSGTTQMQLYSYYNVAQSGSISTHNIANDTSGSTKTLTATPAEIGDIIFQYGVMYNNSGGQTLALSSPNNTLSGGGLTSDTADNGQAISTQNQTLTYTLGGSGGNPSLNYGYLGLKPFTTALLDYVFKSNSAAVTSYAHPLSQTIKSSQFAGFATTGASAGQPITVQMNGILGGLSSLTPLNTYYLNDTAGTIGTSAGTNSKVIGRSIDATHLLITP